jgi:hypothetical protein
MRTHFASTRSSRTLHSTAGPSRNSIRLPFAQGAFVQFERSVLVVTRIRVFRTNLLKYLARCFVNFSATNRAFHSTSQAWVPYQNSGVPQAHTAPQRMVTECVVIWRVLVPPGSDLPVSSTHAEVAVTQNPRPRLKSCKGWRNRFQWLCMCMAGGHVPRMLTAMIMARPSACSIPIVHVRAAVPVIGFPS